jgi:hypothetical protein
VGSFEDCNTTLTTPFDTAGTYDYHGYWGSPDFCPGCSAPYSYDGKAAYDARYHTYRTNHSGGKAIAVQEYAYCNLSDDGWCW